MTTVRPRQLAHRGVLPASGILVDVETLGEAAARARVLTAWEGGAVVHRTRVGLLVAWSAPRMMRAETAPGALVVRENRRLLALPLCGSELRALDPPPNALVHARAGVASIEALDASSVVDPAEWIDVTFDVIETTSLGEAPPAPALSRTDPPAAIRSVFGDRVPPLDAKAEALANELRRGRGARGGSSFVFGAIGAMLSALSRFRLRLRSTSQTSARRTTLTRRTNPVFAFWRTYFAQWFNRLVELVGLSRVLGGRKAAFLRRMMDMFESEDWDNAMRNAIPLANESTDTPAPVSLGIPSPRASLEIQPMRAAASSTFAGGPELHGYLRRVYRQAFERLDAAGDHVRAAFVLAELLRANEEAVAYLERHGEARLAAEVAEARGLAAGLIVRQWFVAGEPDRAVEIARRTGAFPDAISRLERGRPELAASLRMLWGASLAAAGNYATAALVVADVASARERVFEWLANAWSVGGLMRAHALALKLSLAIEPTAEERAWFGELLREDDSDSAHARWEMASALLARPDSNWGRAAARALSRALVRDAVGASNERIESTARRLVKYSNDGTLRADLPPFPKRTRTQLSQRAEWTMLHIDSDDRGAIAIADLAGAPRGGVLIALGEAGVRWLARDGRTVATFDVPAERLVVSDHGDRVLALARRGEAWRVSRIDLRTRRSQSWFDARLTQWADTFDGDTWIVACDRQLLALDATASGLSALRRIDGLGVVGRITRERSAVAFATEDGSDVERWQFELPSWTLRSRRVVTIGPDDWIFAHPITMLDNDGLVLFGVLFSSDASDSPVSLVIRSKAGEHTYREPFLGRIIGAAAVAGDWVIATSYSHHGDVEVFGVQTSVGAKQCVRLAARRHVAVRVDSATLWIGDDVGHAMRIDLETGAVRQRWLIR